MACLTRYLSLMIGDKLVDRDDEYWQLYLEFRKIIGIITAPTFVLAEVFELKELIEKFLEEFVRLLRGMPPKGHIFTHFVELLLLIGPLILVWGMPFERKNREIKLVATGTSSKKDLPYTIAISNQLYMCYLREKVKNLGDKIVSGNIVNNNAEKEFQRIYPSAKSKLNCKQYSSITKIGKLYQHGTIIVFKIGNEPTFGKILQIYGAKGHFYFYIHLLKTVQFEDYYHAFEVVNLPLTKKNCRTVNVNDLPDTDPCVMHTNKSGTFVATRYDL